MRRFAQLFRELDESNRTLDKVEALARYFREVPPADGAWALWLLLGRKFPARVRSAHLRAWAGDLAGVPDWLLGECYERVGDSAETVALLVPGLDGGPGTDEGLCRFVEDRVLPLSDWDPSVQFQLVRETWSRLNRQQAFVFNKMLTGNLRVGAARGLVIRGLSEALALDTQVVTHRLMGEWQPSAAFFEALRAPEGQGDEARRPYPFYLASPLNDPQELGAPEDWLAEWKWDGIRAQLLKRGGDISLWTRGEELVTDSYPEVVEAARFLPAGTVLDGELLCWRDDAPLHFNALQTRISRKQLTSAILRDCPVAFMAYDCLEWQGRDIREQPQAARRAVLEGLLGGLTARTSTFRLSELVPLSAWDDLRTTWERSRDKGVEGLMLKHRAGPYRVGRVKGQWWKWKVAPYTVDLVMIYAQTGTGRRANFFTDYTFGAWEGEELVPVAKAYSGLSDAEIREVDAWVKRYSLAKHGPVRVVPPVQVFEIAFEGIRASSRHRSGVAMRFPRIARWRRDKPPAEADTVANLRALIAATGGAE